jgi:hypothetical protein
MGVSNKRNKKTRLLVGDDRDGLSAPVPSEENSEALSSCLNWLSPYCMHLECMTENETIAYSLPGAEW